MKLEVGGTYKFSRNGKKMICEVQRFDGVNYAVTVIENEFKPATVGHVCPIYNTMLSSYTIEALTFLSELDKTAATNHIKYTSELIELFIDMALQTKDKAWFNRLVKMKQNREVTA